MRYVTHEQVPEDIGFFSVDVAFISLKLILPAARGVYAPDAEAVCLIKPQFEAGRSDIGKRGVVKDRKVHERILGEIDSFARLMGFVPVGCTFSPVRGGSGNIEYLLELRKTEAQVPPCDYKKTVNEAFAAL
jgi:23S rRNA (cytidine1920-2'-O)/16S rRNA (cytidine1409-2'-O)-methyltransferase